MLHVLDTVVSEIADTIASHPPERGGALLGFIGRPFVTRFVFDEYAKTTHVTYKPSRELAQKVKEVEARENLELKGIIHSHPSGMDRPSGQDERELKVGLEINTHMPFYLAPIVTTRPDIRELDHHEIRAGLGKISFFAAHRKRNGQVLVSRIPVTEVPMQQDLIRVCRAFGSSQPPEIFITDFGNVQLPAGRVMLEGLELLFLFSDLYPAVPPILLLTPEGGDTEQVNLQWRIQTPAEDRLLEAVRSFLFPPPPYRKSYGPSGGPALTIDGEQARVAGWPARYTGQDTHGAAEQVRTDLFARSTGLLSQSVGGKRVLAVGLGSVGSYFTEQLARSGVGAFTLIDHESVETANLSRTTYELKDVGRPKVESIAGRLFNINPLAEISIHNRSLLDFDSQSLDTLVRESDIVVAMTDDLKAQRVLNSFSYGLKKSGVFIGLYAGAKGGEVVITVPERTPCYLCATSTRHSIESAGSGVTPEVDYGTGRLKGEVALGADIQHVTSAAVKIALSLMVSGDGQSKLGEFLRPVIDEGMTYLTSSMVPEYWFYPHIFSQVSGQFAYQSVWLTPVRNPECPVCGDPAFRVNHLEIPLRTPQVTRDMT